MNQGAINLGNPVSSSPLNRGLVSWHMILPQRMGGGRLLDLCGNNHGTLAGTNLPEWHSSSGRPGGYGNLYGTVASSSGGKVTLASAVAMGTNKTVSFWVKWATGIGTNIWGGASHFYPKVYDGTFYISDGTQTNLAHGITLAVNTWYWFCCTGDGTTATLYRNGVQVTTGTDRTPTSLTTLMSGQTASGETLNGWLDSFRYHNVALSADQVAAMYREERTGYPQTLNRLPRRSYAVAGGGGGGFQTAWASGSNQVIQPWVAV